MDDEVVNAAKNLQKIIDNSNAKLQEREETVKERESKFESAKKEMEKRYPITDSIIDLNVGGKLYTTFKQTLCSPLAEGSTLEAMFSGRHQIAKDHQGRYFIDRDGAAFGLILNYLRTGVMLWPKDENAHTQLKLELEYYLLHDLIPQTLFPDSKILSNELEEKLIGYLGHKNPWVLLYQGSTDGFLANNFHSKCDGKGATVTIVRSTSGCVFGGYTSQSWNTSGSYTTDSSAFLFCLKNPNGSSCKCLIKNAANAIFGNLNNGPTFGAGQDLYISNNCQDGSSVVNVGNSYQRHQGPHEFTGSANFVVQEIEVFGLWPMFTIGASTTDNNNAQVRRGKFDIRRGKNV